MSSTTMGSVSNVIPSPADDTVIRFKDKELGAYYIELPVDTIFVESLAKNEQFHPGAAYLPVKRRLRDGSEETHLYEIRVDGMNVAKHVAGPIVAPSDDSTDVTVFGTALDSNGFLYMCAFNRNSILGLDLTRFRADHHDDDDDEEDLIPGRVVCEVEIPDLSSPNDICIDPLDDTILYVAGGTGTTSWKSLFSSCQCSDTKNGRIYKIFMTETRQSVVVTQAQSYSSLAGISVFGEEIWISQLFELLKQNESDGGSGDIQTVWKGEDGRGDVWMADDINRFDEKTLICPAYAAVPQRIGNNGYLQDTKWRRSLTSSAWWQLLSSSIRGGGYREALRDPEIDLSFSNTFVHDDDNPERPIRIVLVRTNSKWRHRVVHFEVDLTDTRKRFPAREVRNPKTGDALGWRHHFNEQVTSVSRMTDTYGQGYIVCVNFEQPRILVLEDYAFRRAMDSEESTDLWSLSNYLYDMLGIDEGFVDSCLIP